jgi:protein tyrosine phosphatase (PTP) superfamily phosphohydrolase (DUF442 family)
MVHPRILQLLLVASVWALPLASGEARPERATTTTGKSFAQLAPKTGGIRRFAEIRPGLARGGEPSEEGLQYLRDQGYRTVVSFLTSESESAYIVRSGMHYVHIPIRSGPFSAQPPTEEQVRHFLSVVGDSSRYPIFIHCHAGKDRTGAMSAIYRMEMCGWTADEAVEEMRAFGFSSRYRKLFRFVQGYSGRRGSSSLPADTRVAKSKEASPATASTVVGASVAGSAPAPTASSAVGSP